MSLDQALRIWLIFSMSGSGGGSGRISLGGAGGTGGEGERTSECASLVVETTLNSPVSTVVATLNRGAILQVATQVSGSGVTSLVAKTSLGVIAGALTPPSLLTILGCIQNGFSFVAIVLNDPAGGVVRVRIQAA